MPCPKGKLESLIPEVQGSLSKIEELNDQLTVIPDLFINLVQIPSLEAKLEVCVNFGDLARPEKGIRTPDNWYWRLSDGSHFALTSN
jgi:hypothetical protein